MKLSEMCTVAGAVAFICAIHSPKTAQAAAAAQPKSEGQREGNAENVSVEGRLLDGSSFNVPQMDIEIVHFVLGGIRNVAGGSGSRDVLAASPTQNGGIRGYPPDLVSNTYPPFNDKHFAVLGGISPASILPPGLFPTIGGGYRGGGYRGQKSLSVTSGGESNIVFS